MVQTIQQVIQNSGHNVNNALLIPWAANTVKCEKSMINGLHTVFGSVHLECIRNEDAIEMINQAECIIIGGGDVMQAQTALTPVMDHLWLKVMGGTPIIAVNAGGQVLSSEYLPVPVNNTCYQDYFPLQFIPGYTTANDFNLIDNMLKNTALKYGLGMPPQENGSGIDIEESKAGLAGGSQDVAGTGTSGILEIFTKDSSGNVVDVPWTWAQISHLPINYMNAV